MHVVAPATEHVHTVVLLHGRDSTSDEFTVDFLESQNSDGLTLPTVFPTVKWVFPTAEINPATRFDVQMSQWFDMWSTKDPQEQKEGQLQSLSKSVDRVTALLRQELDHLGSGGKLVLGGISQGFATAVAILLQNEVKLGGLVGFCSWFPTVIQATINTATISQRVTNIPAMLQHCEDDEIIDIKHGENLRETMQSLGMDVSWHQYCTGGHWINEPAGIDDLDRFLRGAMDR